MYGSVDMNAEQSDVGDGRFISVETAAMQFMRAGRRLRVLLLADDALPIGTVRDHIEAIRLHSRHRIVVLNPRQFSLGWSMKWTDFDAIVVHYSISILFDSVLPPPLRDLIRGFRGPKLQIIQDEYRWVDRMTRMMADLGVSAVFSSLSIDNLPRVYHHAHLRGIRFYSGLPGYVAERFLDFDPPPIANRSCHLVYRGQQLPPWFGKGAKEKYQIGEQALRMAEQYGLVADIKLHEQDRIFGEGWIGHLTSGKCVLAAEGGVSVFDFDESIETGAQAYQGTHPEASWDEMWEKTVQTYEGNIIHRTITPRVLESILCRTALVMYPGHFRGLLEPWKHYLPLERDGSNEGDIVRRLLDDQYLQEQVDRAHAHIVNNPDLRYATYVRAIDAVLSELQEDYHQPVAKQLVRAVARPVRIGLEHIVRRAELMIDKYKYKMTHYWPALVTYRFKHALLPLVRAVRKRLPTLLPPLINGNKYRAANALNVLIVSDFLVNPIANVCDHLTAFANYSRNRVCFVHCRTCSYLNIDLSLFDCVVLHHSIIISSKNDLEESFAERLRHFAGYKVLFIRDEYRFVDRTVEAIERLGIDILYSVVNEDVRDRIYHHESIRHVRRKTTLAGFVPERLLKLPVPGYTDRSTDVGYRSGQPFASLGAMNQEKWKIGQQFKKDANNYGLRCDIEQEDWRWVNDKNWISFITNCKAVLGTESLVSFVDFDGSVIPEVDAYQHQHPEETAAEIQARFLGKRDGEIVIRVISQRCFEAAALRTLMILYPGAYSGVLQPWRHYVPLERDHGNMEEVVSVVRDPARATAIIENAYNEIALNTKYSLSAMMIEFDQDLDSFARPKAQRSLEQVTDIETPKHILNDSINGYLVNCQFRSILLFLRYEYLWVVADAIADWLAGGLVWRKRNSTDRRMTLVAPSFRRGISL